MTPLPRISGQECIRALERAGFVRLRQTGSRVMLRRDIPYAQVVVPAHHELDRGTLRNIIRDAGMAVDESVRHL
jgi:predicted RNA binding protein YcfA (HicA-like mRNA interferase family)